MQHALISSHYTMHRNTMTHKSPLPSTDSTAITIALDLKYPLLCPYLFQKHVFYCLIVLVMSHSPSCSCTSTLEDLLNHRLSPHLSMTLTLQCSMRTGHFKFYYLFIYSLQEKRNDISYHLWSKLYVPLILKPCLYLVVLEEDNGVQCILL